MPVRLLSSRIMRWPDRATVDAAIRAHVPAIAQVEPRLRAFGYFGSYARGDWGVGSDVDLVAVLDVTAGEHTPSALDLPWTREIRLPVSHDLFIYSVTDLRRMADEGTRFARMLASEAVWVYGQWPSEPERDAA